MLTANCGGSGKTQSRSRGRKRNHAATSTTLNCPCEPPAQRCRRCHRRRQRSVQRCHENESHEGWLCGRKETLPRDETMPIAPLLAYTPPTPSNTPHGSGRKSKPDLVGGARVFGVSALAFCVLDLWEEKKPRRNTEQGGGHGLGHKVGFACAWIVGGLWEDCSTPEQAEWVRG